MRVEIEGIKEWLEFPDGTDPTVIDKAVKDLITDRKQRESGFMSKYLPSVKRTGEIYQEQYSSGMQSMKQAFEEPTGRSILNGFLGALQYGFSPLTAGVKGLLREPIEGTMKDVGIPDKVAEFGGEMIETGAYFIPYGKAVQMAIVGKDALQATKMAQKGMATLSKIEKAKKPLKFPPSLPENIVADAQMPISAAHKKILRENVIDTVVTELKTPVSAKWIPAGEKRITQEVVDYIAQNPNEIMKAVEKYNLSPDQLAAQMKETMTLAGRDLNIMSQLSKEIRSRFNTPYMRQLSKALETEIPSASAMDKFGNAFKVVENVRRASLIGQFATTFRNIASQGGRVALGMTDDAFQGAANAYLKSAGEKTFSSVKSTLRGAGEGLDLFTAAIHRMKPSERTKLLKILDTKNALEAKAKMFTTPIQDVALTDKYSKLVNTFNTAQEFFFRNIAFEAKLRQYAREAGLDLKNLNPKDLPEKMLTESANYALDMTFAAMPKSTFGKDWVKAMSNPIMTALINPFPRFLYGNALPFLKRFSPLGFLEAAKPSVVADIVSGNPEKFTKAISEATIGTIMLNTAGYLRNSKYAGEHWYEIKVGGKTYDLRAYAPFSTYLFIAEAFQNPERLKPKDFGMALLSLNRIGGTGLVIADVMRGKDVANTAHTLSRLAGAWLSGFTVPARSIKDIYSTIDPEEGIYRDLRENEIISQSMQNIPGVSQILPKRRSPLRVGDIKEKHPLLKQFTGISGRVKNALEKEVDRVQLDYRTIYPGTGIPEGDRKISDLMAPILEQAFPILKTKTNYDQLDVITRKIILKELFKDTKKEVKLELFKTDPGLAAKMQIEDIPDDIKALLKNRGIL